MLSSIKPYGRPICQCQKRLSMRPLQRQMQMTHFVHYDSKHHPWINCIADHKINRYINRLVIADRKEEKQTETKRNKKSLCCIISRNAFYYIIYFCVVVFHLHWNLNNVKREKKLSLNSLSYVFFLVLDIFANGSIYRENSNLNAYCWCFFISEITKKEVKRNSFLAFYSK